MPFPTFPTQAEIPEAFRAEYEERDGKWHPKAVAPDPALGDAGKAALEAERAARKKAEDLAKAEKKRADDLQRTAEAKAAGISDDELTKIRDAEAAARKPIEEERDRLAAENRKLKLTDRVQALALKHGVMAERIEDAMLVLERVTDLTDKDGIVVKDRDGNVTTTSIDDYLSKDLKTAKPWLYSGKNASGSGAEGSDGGGDGSGYDPVKAGKEAAAAQKRDSAAGALAFK